MATKTSPARPRNTATHQAILDAAAFILEQYGYKSLTIERIAKVSGAGKPTIYRWWPNKTAILIELFGRNTLYLETIGDTGSTRKEAQQWFARVWQTWDSPVNSEAFRSLIAEAQSDPESLALLNDNYIKPRRKSLLDILKRAQSRGELAGRNIEAIVDYCGGFNWQHLLLHTHPSQEAIDEVINTFA